MEIKIVEVKLDKALPAAGSRTSGYLGRFSTGDLIGWAVLVPFNGEMSRLKAGARLSVETMYDRVEDWDTSGKETDSTLTPLATPGDYRVNGTIVFVGEHTAAIVEAGGFAFDITTDELPKSRPASESHVAFTLRGLSLWDEGE